MNPSKENLTKAKIKTLAFLFDEKIYFVKLTRVVLCQLNNGEKGGIGMRILYYVPMIHSPEELGSLAKLVLEIEKQVHGPDAEKIYRERVNQYWTAIGKGLEEIGLNTLVKIHIYVDGLPQIEIRHLQVLVQKLIELKLPQYLIIQKLMEKGAIIHGTESYPLLIEEHDLWTNAVKGISPNPKRMAELLRERDEFIARRINETLPEDGTGILFIGANHKVIQKLDKLEEADALLFPIKVISFSRKNLL